MNYSNLKSKDYLQQSLSEIESSRLIDVEKLCKIKDSLTHNFRTGQIFRSRWEMENSVLNDVKCPTPDAKYWQAVREQQVHFEELIMLSYEYRKVQARIELMEARQQKLNKSDPEGAARAKILQIDIEKSRYILIHHKRVGEDRLREILSWHDIMMRLRPYMKYGDDSYEHHQAESYNLRFNREMQIAQKSGVSQSPSEARNLTALHEMSEKEIEKRWEDVNNRNLQEKAEWEPGQLAEI